MGSLMAGWDAHTPDPKAVKYARNRSFTREEIDAYWKSKKKTEEEHLRAISNLAGNSRESLSKGSGDGIQRSNSLPLTDISGNFVTSDSKTSLEKLKEANAWWTRSNWAFLNEPPVIMESPAYKYASQYHLTNTYKPKPDPNSGIGA